MIFLVFPMFTSILEILLLVTAVSADSFAVSLAYGINRVKIPLSSLLVLSAISSGTLACSLLAGSLFIGLIPPMFTRIAGFSILFVLGIIKLFDRSCDSHADKANKDKDNLLTPAEAATLGIALSLDSIAAGLGAGFSFPCMIAAIISAFFVSIGAVIAGGLTGRRIACSSCKDFCWVGGALLILLAFLKLL